MPPAPLLSVVVPVRNEGSKSLPLVAERRALGGVEIVYVDDGSADDTAEHRAAAAGQSGAYLVRRRRQRICGLEVFRRETLLELPQSGIHWPQRRCRRPEVEEP